MRAISLWDQWATLIKIRAKRFETRSFAPSYRGRMLIHASKRFTGLQREISSRPVFADALMKEGILPSAGLLPTLGHLLCVVDLVDVFAVEQVLMAKLVREDSPEHSFGDYSPGRFAWQLENVRLIEPIPFKGSQGFFFVPDRLVKYQEAA